MVTTQHIVNKMLEGKPYLQESLNLELINIGALAEYISKDVIRELGKEVKLSAISMAIRRFKDKIKKSSFNELLVNKKTDFTIKSNLFEVSVQKSSSIFNVLKRLYEAVNFDADDVLNIIQGNYEVLIISNEKYRDSFLKMLSSEKINLINESLTSLSIKIPPECIETPGFFFVVSKTLVWANINIVDQVNTPTELTLILEEKNITKAYNLLRNLFSPKDKER